MQRQRDGNLAVTVVASATAAALAAVVTVTAYNALAPRGRRPARSFGKEPPARERVVSFSGTSDRSPIIRQNSSALLRQNSHQQEATIRAIMDDDADDVPLKAPGSGAMSRRGRRKEEAMRAKEEIIGAITESTIQRRHEGFSMEDAFHHAQTEQERVTQLTPREVLGELQKGNTRFWMGVANRPEMSAFERRALIMNQYPQVAVLGCADSRVPTEIVFDQGLGDLFVVRVAGNCVDCATSASLQYAVKNLKVKIIIVMGHEGCGAVKAARLPREQIEKEPENLRTMLLNIKDGLDEERLKNVLDHRAHDREAVVTNVNHTLKALQSDEAIMSHVRSGNLMLVGAFYEISSGIVDFVTEIH